MDEHFLNLSSKDRIEVLEIAASKTGRPAHLLEKDVWVVWALSALFDSELANDLTFKGGTSLSKAYNAIDRFSEDLDLTYDIRKLIGDLNTGEEGIPSSKSQADKWTKVVRERLPEWIKSSVIPILDDTISKLPAQHGEASSQIHLEIRGAAQDQLLINYAPLKQGTGYVSPHVILEFGARATGEPHEKLPIYCDMESHVSGVIFPTASPIVMKIARTFWEKATAAHVFCAQGRIKGDRYSRHWYDLVMLNRRHYAAQAIADQDVAHRVVQHKSWFFREKYEHGKEIDYKQAISGKLKIVPDDLSRQALENDYAKMIEDGILVGTALSFAELMHTCLEIEIQINQTYQNINP